MAYQVPKVLKMMNQKPIPTVAPTAPAAGAATPATGTPAAPATGAPAIAQPVAAAPSADALVVNSDLSPTALDGQLTSFTRFTSKDPFQPQVSTAGTPVSSTSPTSTKPPATPSGSTVPPGTPTSSTPPGPVLSATLSVNGVEETVNVNADFPSASPLFHLVALTATTAKISIAGGSLASGAPVVTLRLGKPLTLMNTADGTRYKLVLVSTSASAAATTAPASTSAPASATPTTPTTTTPGK
jgi:hypothetical protein